MKSPAVLARFSLTLLALNVAMRPGVARADKVACVAASEKGQTLRMQNQLIQAKDQFLSCTRAACPGVVKRDCEQWLGEVEAAIPSVVMSATDGSGRDVSDIRVLLDGAVLVEKLDGKAVAINPGEHAVRFEHGKETPVEQKIIIREGEKRRLIQISFGQPKDTDPPKGGADQRATDTRGSRAAGGEIETPRRSAPIVGWVLVAAGGVAVGVATYFAIASIIDYNHLTECKGSCSNDDVATVDRERWIAGVAGGVGVVAVGIGALILLSDGSTHAKSPAQVGFRTVAGGGVSEIRVSF